jgi:protein-S-isoprenylcysteine O-methyltransferase Ste14
MSQPVPQTRVSWSRIARRIRVPLGFLLAAIYIWRSRPTWFSLVLGATIAGTGVLVRAWASGHVDKNQELATSGPYAYVRNPLYLGSIIIAIGFVIAARDVAIAVAVVVLFAVVYVPVIRSEEAFLRNQFPQYQQYARTVPRLMPCTLRMGSMREGFSRELYLKHREYNALIGTAALVAALVVKILWFPG